MTKVLVTGANGFVGSALTDSLRRSGHEVIAAARQDTGSIDQTTDWSGLLGGVEVVIHLAARAHVPHKPAGTTIDWFREVNTYGATNLAKQAIAAQVKHFIFFSSIGVTGNSSAQTEGGQITEKSVTAPANDYAKSKLEAEQQLLSLFSKADSTLTIVRPPLIYGATARGNFGKLLKLADSSLPLPFAKVDNERTMLSLENLQGFIHKAVNNPPEHDGVYVLADDESVSTAQLVKVLRRGMGRPARLLPVPVSFMRFGGKSLGKEAMFEQLCGNLKVSNQRAKAVFGWQPEVSAADALQHCAQTYRNNHRDRGPQ